LAYLFDTNAISEVFRPQPNPEYLEWLNQIDRDQQLTSTIVVAELYAAAFRTQNGSRWRRRIEDVVLPTMTILPFDLPCARQAGRIQANLTQAGTPIDTADTQIAATALAHDLVVVTANRRHFERIEGLRLKTFEPGLPKLRKG
jgi:predicted nucleic acid-binding protein